MFDNSGRSRIVERFLGRVQLSGVRAEFLFRCCGAALERTDVVLCHAPAVGSASGVFEQSVRKGAGGGREVGDSVTRGGGVNAGIGSAFRVWTAEFS